MRSRQMNEGRQTDECHRRRIVPPDERPSHKKAPRKRENRGAKMACQEGTKMASASEPVRENNELLELLVILSKAA